GLRKEAQEEARRGAGRKTSPEGEGGTEGAEKGGKAGKGQERAKAKAEAERCQGERKIAQWHASEGKVAEWQAPERQQPHRGRRDEVSRGEATGTSTGRSPSGVAGHQL